MISNGAQVTARQERGFRENQSRTRDVALEHIFGVRLRGDGEELGLAITLHGVSPVRLRRHGGKHGPEGHIDPKAWGAEQ